MRSASSTARHLALAFAILGAAAGCAPDTEPVGPDDTTTGNLAASEALVAKGPGVTVWVSPTLEPDWRFERPVWVLRGRASKDLTSVLSFQSDDEFGDAQLVSKRKFEVTLDAPLVERLLAGRRLFVRMDAAAGKQPVYVASVLVEPRLTGFEGSSKLWVHGALDPLLVGSEVLFRGHVSTSSSLSNLAVLAEEGSKPRIVGDGKGEWMVEWNGAGLLLAGAIGADPVSFQGKAKGGNVGKTGAVELRLNDFGVTIEFAWDTWPEPGCRAEVASCLQALPGELGDTSSCAQALEVLACEPQRERPEVPHTSVFAQQLRWELANWYWEHKDDLAGAATLLAAQAAVTAQGVTEVTDPADDPHGHDLDEVVVYSHADTAFPGSDIVWYGAYDRETGALLETIYSAN